MTSQLNKIADYWNQRSSGYSLDNQEELLNDQEKSKLVIKEEYDKRSKSLKIKESLIRLLAPIL